MQALSIIFVIASIVSTRAASVADCEVVPITQWSSSPSNRKTELPMPVKLVIIQHTVTQECFTDADCERIANNIRMYQMNHLQYDDIGISFLVGGNGKIYEGAGWRVGAHSIGYNDKSISVSFIGDFRDKLPTPLAIQATKDFLNCVVYKKHLHMNYHLVGHQQLSSTLSPGAALQALIQTWPHWLKDVSQIN